MLERVCDAHLANELPNAVRGAGSPTTPSRLPAPIGAETSTMPADHRLRLEKLQRVKHARSQAIELIPGGQCCRKSRGSETCGAARSVDAGAQGFRLATPPAT